MNKKILYFGAPQKLERRNALFRKLCGTAAVLLGYYLFVRLTGLSIPCVFRLVTKLKCPGCGITHLFMHLFKLELREAFLSNPLVFVLLPFAGAYLAVKLLFMPDRLENDSRAYKTAVWVLLGIVVAFGIVRNIIGI